MSFVNALYEGQETRLILLNAFKVKKKILQKKLKELGKR